MKVKLERSNLQDGVIYLVQQFIYDLNCLGDDVKNKEFYGASRQYDALEFDLRMLKESDFDHFEIPEKPEWYIPEND